MEFRADGRTLFVGEKEVHFDFLIDTVLDFQNFCVVMLFEKIIPENIYAIDDNGNILWNISDIIKSPYPQAYVVLSRGENGTIVVISFMGMENVIDPVERRVLSRILIK